jgi:hypothetical protein
MSVGLNPSKLDIDQVAGDIARAFFYQFRRAENLKYFLDGKADLDLEGMGYSAADVANLRSAATVLDNMRKAWEGTLAITPAADQRTFPRRICGMGDV